MNINISYFKLFLFYTLSHGSIFLLLNSIYWDDWTIYESNIINILEKYSQAGSFLNFFGYIHSFMISIGPWFYRVATFFLLFGTGIAFDIILKRYKSINDQTRFILVLFFLILPFFWSRVALINFNYTLCYFIFFVAWALHERNPFFSLFLFFLSFNTNSLLVFYLIPFLDIYARQSKRIFELKNFFLFSIKRFELTSLPFLFFTIKVCFFAPAGLYENYNENYSLEALLLTPLKMLWEWLNWLLYSKFLLVVTGVSTLFFSIFFNRLLTEELKGVKNFFPLKFFFPMALFFFTLAGFPYWVLNNVPTFIDWGSRHQLLFPLGGALLLLAFVFLFPKKIQNSFILAITILSILMNLSFYHELYYDWRKQEEIIKKLSVSNKIKNADVILVEDFSRSLNAMFRTYRFYEWNGLIAKSFGNQHRFAINKQDYDSFFKDNKLELVFKHSAFYKASEFDKKKVLKVISLEIKDRSKYPLDIFGKKIKLSFNIEDFD